MTFRRYGHCPACYGELKGLSTFCSGCHKFVTPLLATPTADDDEGEDVAYDIREPRWWRWITQKLGRQK